MSDLKDSYRKYVLGSTHTHIVDPTQEHMIAFDNRKIIIPNELMNIGVTNDEKAEVVAFTIPRFYDHEDLSKHALYIDYINAGGESDSYKVFEEDILVLEDSIEFSWTISNNVTRFKGAVKFAVRFETIINDVITYSWHSEIAQFNVIEGLNVTGIISETYPDLLQQWESKMDSTYQDIVDMKNQIDKIGSLENRVTELENKPSGSGSSLNPFVIKGVLYFDSLTYAQMNEPVHGFLSMIYPSDDYAFTYANGYSSSVNSREVSDPLGYTLDIECNGYLEIKDLVNGRKYIESVSQGEYTLYNLVPNHNTRITLHDSNDDVVFSLVVKPTGNIRMLRMDNVYNFRDLGGWLCDGGTVKYGMLLRGGQLETEQTVMASERDKATVKNFGILEEYDLRDDDAVDKDTIDTSDDINTSCVDGVGYTRTSLNYYKNAMDLNRTDYLDTVKVLKAIMANVINNKPTYFHCAAGADRTGTIAVILEAMLGMSLNDIDHDYELTSFTRMTSDNSGAYTRLRTSPDYRNQIEYIKSFEGSTLAEKISDWAVKAGIELSLINQFRKAMIDGNPRTIVIGNEPPIEKVNQLVISTDLDGSIYNEIGYKENTRLNSSGVTVNANGIYTSGFIPCKYGDTIKLIDYNVLSNNSNPLYQQCYVAYYDDDKTLIKSSYSKDLAEISYNNVIDDSNGFIKSFKVARSIGSTTLTNAKYIRINAIGIGENPSVYVE